MTTPEDHATHGERGEPGATGAAGARGAAGTTGLRGPRGDDGSDVTHEWDTLRVATLALLGLLTLAVGALLWFVLTYVAEQRALSECHRRAFAETNTSLVAITGAAGRDRADLLEVLNALTDPLASEQTRAAALESYKRTLTATNAARADNPLPTRTC
jgi:hypothetical protein